MNICAVCVCVCVCVCVRARASLWVSARVLARLHFALFLPSFSLAKV